MSSIESMTDSSASDSTNNGHIATMGIDCEVQVWKKSFLPEDVVERGMSEPAEEASCQETNYLHNSEKQLSKISLACPSVSVMLADKEITENGNWQRGSKVPVADSVNFEDVDLADNPWLMTSVVLPTITAADLQLQPHTRINANGSADDEELAAGDLASGPMSVLPHLQPPPLNRTLCERGISHDSGVDVRNQRKGLSALFSGRLFSWKEKRSTFGSNTSLNSLGSISMHSTNSGVDLAAMGTGSTGLLLQDRPAGLPPKTAAEEFAHRKQHEEMLRHFKQKRVADERQKARDASRRQEAERDREELLRKWQLEFLPHWEAVRTSEKVRRYWWLGLPAKVRGLVWKQQIGNELNISQELFQISLADAKRLLDRETARRLAKEQARQAAKLAKEQAASGVTAHRRRASNTSDDSSQSLDASTGTGADLEEDTATASGSVSRISSCEQLQPAQPPEVEEEHRTVRGELSLRYILLDVSRTLPEIKLFQQGGPYYDRLVLLLTAYAVYRPDIGYIQGMSFIAAVLLLIMEEDYDAFVCFANILNKPCLHRYYRLHHALLECYELTFGVFLNENLPELAQHFAACAFQTRPLLVDWIFTLYAKNFTFELACRIWDMFLRDGDEFLFRVALGILRMKADVLCSLDFNQMMELLKNPLPNIHEDLLFENIRAVRMSTADRRSFDQVLAATQQERQPEQVIRSEQLLESIQQQQQQQRHQNLVQ